MSAVGTVAIACATDSSRLVGEVGEVRGRPAEAVAVAYLHARNLAPRVAARLGVEQRRITAVVWTETWEHDAAVTTRTNALGEMERRIEIGPQTFGVLDFVVAHELVHWHAAEEPWSRIPHAVEEGLADLIAMELVPYAAIERERRLAEISSAGGFDRSLLEVDSEARHALPKDRQRLVYAVGYAVAKRHGVEGLRALCERARSEGLARVPIEWLDLDPPPAIEAARAPADGG